MSKLFDYIKDFENVVDKNKLPEKWYIQTNHENLCELNKYLHANSDKYINYLETWNVDNDYYFISEKMQEYESCKGRDLSFHSTSIADDIELEKQGYVLITNEDLLN